MLIFCDLYIHVCLCFRNQSMICESVYSHSSIVLTFFNMKKTEGFLSSSWSMTGYLYLTQIFLTIYPIPLWLLFLFISSICSIHQCIFVWLVACEVYFVACLQYAVNYFDRILLLTAAYHFCLSVACFCNHNGGPEQNFINISLYVHVSLIIMVEV